MSLLAVKANFVTHFGAIYGRGLTRCHRVRTRLQGTVSAAEMWRRLPGVCAELLGFLALQGSQVLLQRLQEAAWGLAKQESVRQEAEVREKAEPLSLSFLLFFFTSKY